MRGGQFKGKKSLSSIIFLVIKMAPSFLWRKKKDEKSREIGKVFMLTKMNIPMKTDPEVSPVEKPVDNVENLGLSTDIFRRFPPEGPKFRDEYTLA